LPDLAGPAGGASNRQKNRTGQLNPASRRYIVRRLFQQPKAPIRGGLMGAESRVKELRLELPSPPKPVATYLPAVQTGNLLYVSGHGPLKPDGKMIAGRVGAEMSLEQGKDAARVVGIAILATVRSTLGSLDRVIRLVKVLGMVNSTPDFKDHPQVINGFSDLMVEVFGESGRGARSAVGMGSLPGNITVEVEAIFEVH
jgi:enamine deaminase RidA (YjgF/YER057c/UK114 family)